MKGASHWFGGDLTALFALLGEKGPMRSDRIEVLPDPLVFHAFHLRGAGGGPAFPKRRVAGP